jgi:hypothetical protein
MRFFTCDRLETGREYFLIVTTPGGLYRYNIDDIVRVNGFFNKTPVIEFVQKGLSAFSMTGEKLYESQVNEAVNKASDTLKLLIRFFSATVQRDTPPRYIFLAEFDGSPDRKQKRLLLGAIERELYNVNQEYEYVRNAGLLASPILKVVKHGSFERYKARRLSQGAHDGQFKVPELVPDPEFQKNFEIEEEIWID